MKLARREKLLVSAAASLIAIFFLFQFLIHPFFETKRRLQRGVRAKEESLNEIVRLSAEYEKYRRDSQGIKQILAGREQGFTLFSFLEKEAGDAGVKKYIKYMKPSTSVGGPGSYKESLVEMKLESITLQQLVDYFYRIESPEKGVSIKRISIKENKKKSDYIDTILQVVTFQQ
jgi:general secretion pathway protein M